MQPHVLEIYSEVFSQLQNRRFENDEFKGTLKLTLQLKEALERLYDFELTSGSYDLFKNNSKHGAASLFQFTSAHFNGDITIEVDLSSSEFKGDFVICGNWDALLANEAKVKTPAKNIFFTSDSTLLLPSSQDKKYQNYTNIQRVYGFVKSLAESTEGGERTIFFERPLTFEFTLSESDLLHPIDIEALDKLLQKDLHQEAIRCLICKEFVHFLKDINVKQRFSYLIQHMSSLVSNVLLSYQSYVESYTFDKVRKQYIEKRTEYISKVHTAFDTMATKLLSLPAGIWFATTQLNPVTGSAAGNVVFYKNLSVLITIVVLTGLLLLNLIGQFSILKQQEKEYSALFDELQKSFDEEKVAIDKAKDEIDSAKGQVELKLYGSIFVTLAILGLTVVMFCVTSV